MPYLLIFLGLVLIYFTTRLSLNHRQIMHVRAHRTTVPVPFRDQIAPKTHRKAADYTIAHQQVTRVKIVTDTVLLLLWTIGGGLQAVSNFWNDGNSPALTADTLTVVSVLTISALLSLPIKLFRTFVIEKKYGFNRQTVSGFISDVAKISLLSLALLGPVVYLMLWLMESAGISWWLYAWLIYTIFSLTLTWIFPVAIAPMFNTFKALDNTRLNEAIHQLVENSGFKTRGVFVMDGSRRSSHGNSYFTGMGKNKRIVFFDTLLEKLNQPEILAVLAHELAHFKHKHVLQGILLNSALSLVGFAIVAWMQTQPDLQIAIGISAGTSGLTLLLFLMTFPAALFLVTPFFSVLSRNHEYQADRYAARATSPEDIAAGLVKLYSDNASSLTPDPVYAWFYYSHPTPLNRLSKLTKAHA